MAWLAMVALVSGWCVTAANTPDAGKPKLTLSEFSLQPASLAVGETFTLRARGEAQGVALGSFLLRTAEPVAKQMIIPGFPLRANDCLYVAEKGKYFLPDNGEHDKDSRAGYVAMELSTQGWKDGSYTFALFASSRPAPGMLVTDRREFVALVQAGRITLEERATNPTTGKSMIQNFSVVPSEINAGEVVRIKMQGNQAYADVRIRDCFYIAPQNTLPGFSYHAQRKQSFLSKMPDLNVPREHDLDTDAHGFEVVLDTKGWPCGVHRFILAVVDGAGREVDNRPFAIRVRNPQDRLAVVIEPSVPFISGTHFGRFLQLRDGTLLSAGKTSPDGGKSWRTANGIFGEGAEQLRDGSVVGLAYRCLPDGQAAGGYVAPLHLSKDGRQFTTNEARFFVPEAKAAQGHAAHPGPLFMRSIIQRTNGSLVALMAGWFKSDNTPCPYGRGRPYSRSYTCESADGGHSWRYLTTIGYEEIGSEGYNEGSMRRLPDGTWLAVLRTGSPRDIHCQDNPMMWSVSRDEGRTWSRPQRTGLEGCYPSLAVLSDGSVALSYGRPGAMLAFSADGGRSWQDVHCVDPTPYSGYTDVVEIEPGVLLVGFGATGFVDPTTGEHSDQLRLARVKYQRR